MNDKNNNEFFDAMIMPVLIIAIGIIMFWGGSYMVQSINEADKRNFEDRKTNCSQLGENWRYSPSEGWGGMCRNIKTNETQPLTY
jgi:hypothetical protein